MRNYALSAFASATLAKSPFADTLRGEINDILLVGAKPNPANLDQLSRNDDRYVETIVDMSQRLGLKFGAHAALRGCDYPKTDFLDSDLRADMVVFCKIYYDPRNSLSGRVIDRSQIRQSPLCNEKGIWYRALMNTGALFAVNVHKNEVELPTAFIKREPFFTLASENHSGVTYDFLARPHI